MRCPCSFPVYHIYPIFDNKKQGINKIYLLHNRDISKDIKTPKRKIAADMILPAVIRTLWFHIRRKQTAAL